MTYTYCVWYRVSADGPDTETVLRSMMARLACRTGITGRLMKKRDEPRLWMEVYQGIVDAGAFESRLAQAVDEYDVGMFVAGERRVECFVDEAPVSTSCAQKAP